VKHLVIGCGEVGQALMDVLDCSGYDPKKGYNDRPSLQPDIIHICIPYCERFSGSVHGYQSWLKPQFTVIHSTVPIGTCDSLDSHHSPIRGRHPHLATSIRTFRKYIGGPESEIIRDEFIRHDIPATACRSARDTEAGKLMDLMQFGQSILLEKAIYQFCDEYQLSFELVYSQFNKSYNAGYGAMECPQYQRPILEHMEGPIGGHCIVDSMAWLDMKEARDIANGGR